MEGQAQNPAELVRSTWGGLGPTFVAGLREIWAHKFRSLLTMLGIVLGVSSLVAMSGLVTGMEHGAREALIAIGGLARVRIEPADLPVDQRHLADQAAGITLRDVEALERSAPLVRLLSPEMRIPATVSANGRTFRPWICLGVRPAALEMLEHRIAHGRMFNELDDELARNVCVIGTATRDELWGSPEQTGREIVPIGETLYINGVPFVIIGMFEHYESEQERRERQLRQRQQTQNAMAVPRDRGQVRRPGGFAFRLKNSTVLIPLNTVWMRFRDQVVTSGFGPRWFRNVETLNTRPDPVLSGLEVKVVSVDLLPEALQQIRNVLMLTHRGIEDFQFRTQEEWAEQIDTFVRNARLSGGLIAAISLLVGGIGIMNIMLASISERVREIGIRKSVGASDSDIFVQILVESVVIAVLGGLLGMAAALGLVQLVSQLSPTGNEPIITPLALGVAFGFSVLVGIVAGIYPAVKAARLSPIEALRYE
ncbi:MAG: ABC transporter permease [Verrucomicrobiota bacterium]|nr:ABC transporter permease [Limisphaera sp.]MDW8382386.1 ABC transporter permease [Verrucomicrobiota bacterium]